MNKCIECFLGYYPLKCRKTRKKNVEKKQNCLRRQRPTSLLPILLMLQCLKRKIFSLACSAYRKAFLLNSNTYKQLYAHKRTTPSLFSFSLWRANEKRMLMKMSSTKSWTRKQKSTFLSLACTFADFLKTVVSQCLSLNVLLFYNFFCSIQVKNASDFYFVPLFLLIYLFLSSFSPFLSVE